MDVASGYHSVSSNSRLAGGKPTTTTTARGAEGGIGAYKNATKNLARAVAVKDERKTKREEEMARQKGTSIKVDATLWGTNSKGRLSQVSHNFYFNGHIN